jgi:hypothetical protein
MNALLPFRMPGEHLAGVQGGATEQREAFGVRPDSSRFIRTLSRAAEFAALQTLRDSGAAFADLAE